MTGGILGFLTRLVRGDRWVWLSDDYRAALPPGLPDHVMAIESSDRHHAKQGRSTARVRFDSPWGGLSVYLKRHDRLPIRSRLAAILHPSGRHSPGAAEWGHLGTARALGVSVPDTVAAGERIGPWGKLQSFLMVAELIGSRELNEAIPELLAVLPSAEFARLKRGLAIEAAEIAARLHNARMFHKDFYLCHLFLDLAKLDAPGRRLTLIDLHRLGRHSFAPRRWLVKDLGQLLFSTFAVPGVDDRDRLRFWRHYLRLASPRSPRSLLRAVRAKAARYEAHNRPR